MVSYSKRMQREMELKNKLKSLVSRYDFHSVDSNFADESMLIINRILKDCIKVGVIKSSNDLKQVFDALCLLDLSQLNKISKDEIYRKGVNGIIRFCHDEINPEKGSYFKNPETLI